MKKFISLLIGCSLVLAGAALAQPPTEASPTTEKPAAEKTPEAQPKRGAKKAAKTEPMATEPTGAVKEPGAATEPGAKKGRKGKAKSATEPATEAGVSGQATGSTSTEVGTKKGGRKGRATTETSATAETGASAQPTASTTPEAKHQAGQRGKGKNARGAKATTTPSATPVAAATATPATAAGASTSTSTSASAAPTAAATGQLNTQAGAGAAVKVDKQKVQQVKQKVQQIKQQHVNFRAQPRPDRVPPVQFNASFRIQGSDRWQGPQYEVYRSYHPERHDRTWYSSHFNRVELISGGYYYWNNGYWYPAWGYDSSNEYYAYDAPIYVGQSAEPPDRIIASVQAALQEMGYYRGEVDGLLGPLTREALTAYQADQGLTITQVIDQPTLDSLGMG